MVSKDTRIKMSKSRLKGLAENRIKTWNKGIKTGITPWKGKERSLEDRKKMSETRKRLFKEGKIKSPVLNKDIARKIRDSRKYNNQLWHSEETKKKIKNTLKLKGIKPKVRFVAYGKDHPLWNGGTGELPYPYGWKNKKLVIKNRDGFKCIICGKNDRLSVHHIDYNRNNLEDTNLISLCNRCHGKTNIKRNYWAWQFQIYQELFNGGKTKW